MSNKRLIKLLQNRGGELEDGDYLDLYNQSYSRGIAGTILIGGCKSLYYVIEIKDSPSD